LFQKPTNSMLARLMFLLVAMGVVAFVAIAGKLFYMQVVDYSFYQQKALANQTRDTIIAPTRGTIYDTNMKVLAMSASAEEVDLTPKLVKDEEEAKLIAQKLSELLDVSYDTILKKALKNTSYERIKRSVDKEVADEIRAFANENGITAISMVPDTKRYYPYGDFASNILGFMGTDEGLSGLESYYEDALKGVPGRIISATNAKGVELASEYERYYEAQNGDNLVLTVDEVLQHYLEKNLEIAIADNDVQNKATGIIMDVKTGAILAMATKGDFDPNDPFTITDDRTSQRLAALTGDEYKTEYNLALQEQWQSRALTEPYEPGSTFKIITSAIALEEGALSGNETFSCPGYIMLGKQRIGCWKAGGHGTQDFLQGLKNSCNPVFVAISQKIGTATFRKYFEDFGFMAKTGIDLGGEANGVYHAEKDFHELELAIAAFGQRFKVTPIQLLTAVCAVANDGKLMKPYIVKEIQDANGNVKKSITPTVVRQVISAETSDRLCSMLEQVVADGSGRQAYVAGYRMAGKTGTSQKMDIVDESGQEIGLRIASFVGFAPADDPQVAVLVLLDEPMGPVKFGGQIAAPVVRRIMSEVLPYMGIEPQYTEEELAAKDVQIPDLTGKTVAEAEKALNDLKISFRKVGSGDTVTDQTPTGGAKIPGTATVILYLGVNKSSDPIQVPDVNNMSVAQAKSALERLGLYMKTAGTGSTGSTSGMLASYQEPAAGSAVQAGAVITVEFRDPTDMVG